jgi:hypothetical protein
MSSFDLSESVPASMKLRSKVRKGSRVMRHYDQPSTPLQRVLQSQKKTLPQIQGLKSLVQNTNPFELSRRIDQQLDSVYPLAAQRNGATREKTPIRELRPNPELDQQKTLSVSHRSGCAWRDWTFSQKLKRQKYEIQRQIRTQSSVRFSHDSTNPSAG